MNDTGKTPLSFGRYMGYVGIGILALAGLGHTLGDGKIDVGMRQQVVTQSVKAPSSVDKALYICRLFDATKLASSPCSVGGFSSTITLNLDMSSSEARKFCAQLPELLVKAGADADLPGWTVRVESPYSGEKTIATCSLD